MRHHLKAFIIVMIFVLLASAESNQDLASYCPPTNITGEYTIKPLNTTIDPFRVNCEFGPYGGENGSIVIARFINGRQFAESENCASIRNGFGSPEDEFWLGLEKMHQIVRGGDYGLTIVLKTTNGNEGALYYDKFDVGSEAEQYAQSWGSLVGGATDDHGLSLVWTSMRFDSQRAEDCYTSNILNNDVESKTFETLSSEEDSPKIVSSESIPSDAHSSEEVSSESSQLEEIRLMIRRTDILKHEVLM